MVDFTKFFDGPFDAAKFSPSKNDISSFPIDDFKNVLQQHGFIVDEIQMGKLVRCGMSDCKGAKSNPGWYQFFLDIPTNFATGIFGDWRDGGITNKWCSRSESDLTAEQIAGYEQRVKEAKEKAQKEKELAQAKAKEKAQRDINLYPKAQLHPYLTKKNVQAHGLYSDPNNGNLIIPMSNIYGEVESYQMITSEGDKWFLPDGKTEANFHFIGDSLTDSVYLVEGYSTGATVHELTGQSVICAFNTGNLMPVLEQFADAYPNIKFIIAADSDRFDKHGNPPKQNWGVVAAQEAVKGFDNAKVIIPQFPASSTGSDFNDLASEQGTEAAKHQLLGTSNPPFIDCVNTTAERETEVINYLVEDFFVSECSSMVFGEPGSGKSFLVQDIGMCVATGKDWHGREVIQGPVLYVCGEGFQDLHHRITAWKLFHGYEKSDTFPFFNSTHELNFLDPVVIPQFIDFVKRFPHDIPEPIKFVIIDTLSTNFGDGDENSKDMAIFINNINRIAKETGTHVCVVHHSGKDKSKGARGGSSAKGNVSTYIKIEPCGEREMRLVMEKQKTGPSIKPLIFDLSQVHVGSAKDHKGRMKDINSLVPKLKQDTNVGEEAAANIISSAKKRVGKNLLKAEEIVIDMAQRQLDNRPEMEEILISKTDLNNELRELISDSSNRRKMISRLIEDGILEWLNEHNYRFLAGWRLNGGN